MRMRTARLRGRRGASLVLAAISLTALIGMGALAVDLGMLYKARADALQAAEAGALAGASAFMDFADPFSSAARQEASDRAREYAMRNAILSTPVADEEVGAPVVVPESLKVRLTVGRQEVGTWFARILGSQSVPISARAAAAVEEGDAVSCVLPLMMPDIWDERSGDDENGNDLEDGDEEWTFDSDRDRYDSERDGYGSDARNPSQTGGYTRDFGRPITLEPTLPGNGNANGNGNGNGNGNSNGNGNGNGNVNDLRGLNQYDFWTFEGENMGNPDLVNGFEECRDGNVGLDDEFDVYPVFNRNNSARNDIRRELRDRIQADGSTRWDQSTRSMASSLPDWRSSPRVIKVALYGPEQMENMGEGRGEVTFNNVALFFLENVDNDHNITGRFLYYVTGSGSGDEDEDGGSLVKHVRLVE